MPRTELRSGSGRLAQLVERYIDVVDVRGSSPLSPTKNNEADAKHLANMFCRVGEEENDGGGLRFCVAKLSPSRV